MPGDRPASAQGRANPSAPAEAHTSAPVHASAHVHPAPPFHPAAPVPALRPLLLASLLCGVLLAGCAQTPAPTDSSTGPDDSPIGPGTPGATTESDLWVVYSRGCGFCSGQSDVPEFQLVALHRDGTVAAVDYALDSALDQGNGARLRPGLEPYKQMVERVFTQARPYAAFRDDTGSSRPVHVLGVASARLSAEDLDDVRARVESALAAPGERGSQEYDRTDCGAAIVEAFGEPRAGRERDGCGIEAPPGWQDVAREMQALEAWARLRGDITLSAPDGSLMPTLAAVRRDATNATVLAALHMRACGGLLHGCSGASGIVLYGDGRVHAFWGTPWGPGDDGETACTPGGPLQDLGRTLGDGWEVPCAQTPGLAPPRSGAVTPGAWAMVAARLAATEVPDVPAASQEQGCCDRVFTVVRFHLRGTQDHVAVEGTDVEGAQELAGIPVARQLLALQAWAGPSLHGPWQPE